MPSHTYHLDTHEHGLADECPRCNEHAEHPFESLDTRNLRNLVSRVEQDLGARSANEAKAMEEIQLTIFRCALLTDLRSG